VGKLLYVDDEPFNLKVFEINFRGDFEVVLAGSGHEGVKKIEEHPDINIVISDMKMPEMNGLEFIELAKAKKQDLDCYILTGFNVSPEIEAAIQKHLISDYFRKPFDVDEIRAKVTKVN
jgi:CheY-like chemotaxis protein